MNWRRVAGAAGFAVFVTAVGYLLRSGPGVLLLRPGLAVGRLLDRLDGDSRSSWFGTWLLVYAQLFFWVLVRELARILSNRLRSPGEGEATDARGKSSL